MTVANVSPFQVHVQLCRSMNFRIEQVYSSSISQEITEMNSSRNWPQMLGTVLPSWCTGIPVWAPAKSEALMLDGNNKFKKELRVGSKPELVLFVWDQIMREQLVYKTEEHSWIIQCIYCIISICDFKMSIIFKTKASLKCQVHILSKLGNITKSNLLPENVIALRKISVSQMQPNWH